MGEAERDADRDLRKQQYAAVAAISQALVGAAAGWFLLTQLASVLRPLLVAVFLAYVLLPYHARLRRTVGAPASLGLLATATVAVLFALALAVHSSVVGLNDERARVQSRVADLVGDMNRAAASYAPWLTAADGRFAGVEERLGELAARALPPLLDAGRDLVFETCVIGLYLLFLLLEASRFPARVRKAYPVGRADQILHVAGQVNAAIVGYLRAKVKSSLLLALPAGLALAACGVRFAPLWAVLTFLCNFVPYVGSVVAFALPVGFAFVQFDLGWPPFAAAGALLALHLVCGSMVEPAIIGKAVGLSPLVILAALAFWGLLWGLPGMFLAVPLTVVSVIVMDHFEPTRSVARLVSDG